MRVKFTGFVEVQNGVPEDQLENYATFALAEGLEGVLEGYVRASYPIKNLSLTFEETKVPAGISND